LERFDFHVEFAVEIGKMKRYPDEIGKMKDTPTEISAQKGINF